MRLTILPVTLTQGCALALCLAVALPTSGNAQFGKFLKKKAEEIATKAATDAAASAVAGEASPSPAGTPQPAPVTSTVAPPGGGAPAAAPAATPTAASAAWLNFDFQPGVTPLFVDDFTKDNVGDFPRRLEFVRGNMEVAEWNGARWLRVSQGQSRFAIVLEKPLPERFTLEFDATAPNANIYAELRFGEKAPGFVSFREFGRKGQGGIGGTGATAQGATAEPLGTTGREAMRVRVMVDGKYAKVYLNETRVANVPNADLGRSQRITFDVAGTTDQPMLLANLSLMAGGGKLYETLAATGRVATQGIYFDAGSDRIRPESAPTLKEISGMLASHSTLRLTIEGHTDSVGSASANQALSERRAAAVRQALIASFGADSSRLVARGLGASAPVAGNDTPEGRQANRRVELASNKE